MNLACPKCSSENTQKLTLVMNKGGLIAKGARFGAVYVYNVWIPLATVLGSIAFGIVFAMFNGYLGLLVFVGILFSAMQRGNGSKQKRDPSLRTCPTT